MKNKVFILFLFLISFYFGNETAFGHHTSPRGDDSISCRISDPRSPGYTNGQHIFISFSHQANEGENVHIQAHVSLDDNGDRFSPRTANPEVAEYKVAFLFLTTTVPAQNGDQKYLQLTEADVQLNRSIHLKIKKRAALGKEPKNGDGYAFELTHFIPGFQLPENAVGECGYLNGAITREGGVSGSN